MLRPPHRHRAFESFEPVARGLAHRLSAIFLVAAIVGVAVLLGASVSTLVPPDVLEEGGQVEAATIWFYLVASATVLLAAPPAMNRLDKAAIALLLLACAAREADLHVALFQVSILKSSFYLRHGTPGQIAVALCIVLPVLLSLLLLLRRHGALWLAAPSRWRAPVVTVMTFAVLMLVSKVFDRLPALMVEHRILEAVPPLTRNVLLALEEVLELALPLLAILAVVQGRLQARLGPAG